MLRIHSPRATEAMAMSRYGSKPVVWATLDKAQQNVLLQRPAQDAGERGQAVADIIRSVREGGDETVQSFTQRAIPLRPSRHAGRLEAH